MKHRPSVFSQIAFQKNLSIALFGIAFTIMSIFSLFGGSAVASTDGDSPELIPNVFVPYDTGNTTDYILIVEKSSQTLSVWEYNGKPRQLMRFRCSTGKNAGAKQVSGDAKTPEGVYFFTKAHEDSELSPIYGIKAFPTDYPNLIDRRAGRTGSAIWLHGTNRPLVDRDSNGCVVLENENLRKVTPYITLQRTPIIITKTLTYETFDTHNNARNEVLQLVDDWAAALEDGSYHQYLHHYSPDFVPDIAWWDEWRNSRKLLKSEEKPVETEVRDLSVFRHDDLFVVLFDIHLKRSEIRQAVGAKKLFLSRRNDRMEIVGESYQGLPLHETPKNHPVLLASRRLEVATARPTPPTAPAAFETEGSPLNPDEIESMVTAWLAAWSSQDIDAYGAFYADDFRSRKMDKTAWLAYKSDLNRKYDYIRVTHDNLNVRRVGGDLLVSFTQNYESDRFKAVGVKTLRLTRDANDGQWKIFRENYRKH